LTFVFDVLKGFVFVYFAPKNINPETVAVVAVGAHIFSVWIGFRGGKGVATALGALLGVYPYAALASVIVWGVLMKYSKITSLSSIVSFLTLPLFGYLFYKDLSFFIMMSLIIIATHVPNIKRMIAGNEHKF
ncbi:MAG: glycerol-3-phosphate acyltransferase, partial [Alphaproteobacteria bacterium]|nr:glycerol-3-phosphate acyltransferase [Alphaproteobacteria bacterium]